MIYIEIQNTTEIKAEEQITYSRQSIKNMSCYVASGLEDASEKESMVSHLPTESFWKDLDICHFLDIENAKT